MRSPANEEEPLSRTGDEEGFHPHPGDPWHPDWGADAEEPAAEVEEKPRRRGLFGRRKRRRQESAEASTPEPEQPQEEEAELDVLGDEGPPSEYSGWGPDDPGVAWTDDGMVSAQFESAFTVGGDLESAPAETAPAEALLPTESDSVAEEAGLEAVEAIAPDERPAEESLRGEPASGEEDDELARAAEQALAALGAVEQEADAEEAAAEVAAAELDAVEVEEPPGYQGLQDTLALSDDEAVASVEAEPAQSLEALVEDVARFEAAEGKLPDEVEAEPGAAAELPEVEEAEEVAFEERPATAEDVGLSAADAEPEAGGPAELPEAVSAWEQLPDEAEIEERLAELPSSEAAAEDLSALTELGTEEDDLDDWQAFAEGEDIVPAEKEAAGAGEETRSADEADSGDATAYSPPPLLPEDLSAGAVSPPLAPPAHEELEDAFRVDDAAEEEEPPTKRRGWRRFGRRKADERDEPAEPESAEVAESTGEPTQETAPPSADATEAQWGPLDAAEGGEVADERETGLGSAPEPSPPLEQRLSELPLVEEDPDRLEVLPVVELPESGDWAGRQRTVESDEEAGEYLGDAAAVPEGWEAPVDEDEVEVPPMEAADVEWEDAEAEPAFPEEAPELEAGEMLPVDDILEPLAPAAEEADGPHPDLREPETPEEPPAEGGPVGAEAGPAAAGDAVSGPVVEPEEPAPERSAPWERPAAEGSPSEVAEGEPAAGPELYAAPATPMEGSTEWSTPRPAPWEGVAAEEDEADVGPAYDEPMAPAADDEWMGGEPDEADGEWSDEIYVGSGTSEHRGLADAIARASTEETELQGVSAAMPGLETGVVGFEDVEDLGTDEQEEYVPPAPSDLGMRVLTGLALVALLLGALWAGGAALAVFIGIVIMVGLAEYYTTLRGRGYAPLALFGYLGGAGALVGTWLAGPIAIPGAILATAAVVFFFYAFAPQRRDALTNGALTVFGVVWIAGAASFAMPIVDSADHRVLVFALVAATVAMDVGAYGFGRAWGSAQLAPILSPNKSIEGLAGGVVLAIGVALGIGYLMDPFDIQAGAALGLIVAVLAPFGDLAESMFKRSLGVKDLGTVLPGHGGIVDRVDALLFVIPAAWVLYDTLGYLN